jgi:hypothetical protein
LERKIKSEKREQTKQPPGPVFLCSAHLPPRQPRFCSLVRLCSVGPTGRHSSRAPDFQPTAFSSVAVVWTQLDFFVEVRPNADQWGLVVRSSPTLEQPCVCLGTHPRESSSVFSAMIVPAGRNRFFPIRAPLAIKQCPATPSSIRLTRKPRPNMHGRGF